jgi:hypothetical protein
MNMAYADIIAREADSLPLAKQAEVLDFIEFLKDKQNRTETKDASMPKTAEEIEAIFRSFNVDTSNFKFDREEANAR